MNRIVLCVFITVVQPVISRRGCVNVSANYQLTASLRAACAQL